MDSIRLALAIAASRQWEVHHMDVKCVFLNGDLTEEIYMQQPQGFSTNPSLVCRLRKSLYGLKQAPRAWYAKIDSFLLSLNFFRCKSDPNVYLKSINGSLMIIVLYVDDLLITGSSKDEIASLKGAMNQAFSMTDLGLLSQFLGLEIAQTKAGIKVHQSNYALDLLNKFRMKDCKPSKTPFLSGVKLEEADSSPIVNNTLYRKLIGCFLYITHTRPDISYAVSVASRYMDQPHEIHWKAAKMILNFVQGTRTHGIFYKAKFDLDLIGFTDSDWEDDNIDRKSTSGYVFMLAEGPISWSSKKQSAIALSSTEAE